MWYDQKLFHSYHKERRSPSPYRGTSRWFYVTICKELVVREESFLILLNCCMNYTYDARQFENHFAAQESCRFGLSYEQWSIALWRHVNRMTTQPKVVSVFSFNTQWNLVESALHVCTRQVSQIQESYYCSCQHEHTAFKVMSMLALLMYIFKDDGVLISFALYLDHQLNLQNCVLNWKNMCNSCYTSEMNCPSPLTYIHIFPKEGLMVETGRVRTSLSHDLKLRPFNLHFNLIFAACPWYIYFLIYFFIRMTFHSTAYLYFDEWP